MPIALRRLAEVERQLAGRQRTERAQAARGCRDRRTATPGPRPGPSCASPAPRRRGASFSTAFAGRRTNSALSGGGFLLGISERYLEISWSQADLMRGALDLDWAPFLDHTRPAHARRVRSPGSRSEGPPRAACPESRGTNRFRAGRSFFLTDRTSRRADLTCRSTMTEPSGALRASRCETTRSSRSRPQASNACSPAVLSGTRRWRRGKRTAMSDATTTASLDHLARSRACSARTDSVARRFHASA